MRGGGGFVVGCLEGGGGGCETSDEEVVSIDKERMDFKGDAMCRRDACDTVDNMMRVCMVWMPRNAFWWPRAAPLWLDTSRETLPGTAVHPKPNNLHQI